ncbi:uncharacterized protein LOC116016585 [Ipomoea triloba]|uniref:uncharacterized protein LOC116016585 n=1 Tax=Ipomoea triloba TaxID=35885 RepID=UPI00125DCB82|nr:uncharacterized protein LOC116016585 [Ipomoea triloba]
MFSLPTHQQLDLKFLTLKLCCIEISTFLRVLPITPSNNNIRCKEKSTIIAELLSRSIYRVLFSCQETYKSLEKGPGICDSQENLCQPGRRCSSRCMHFQLLHVFD